MQNIPASPAIFKSENAVSKPSLLTAELIQTHCPTYLQDLGKRIAAHYDKLVQYEDKAEQHKIAIGQLLVQAKEACDAGGFAAFRERFCPNLGKSRAYELLAIAAGKKTIEETKTATRERVQRHRAAKAATSVTVTDNTTTEAADAEASAEKRKALYASETGPEPVFTTSEPSVTATSATKPTVATEASTSDDGADYRTPAYALDQFKLAYELLCRQWLPLMDAASRAEAIKFAVDFEATP